MLNFSRWFLKGPWAILFIDEIIGMSWSNYSTPPCCCIPARNPTIFIIIRCIAWSMWWMTCWPCAWCPKHYFFHNLLQTQNSKMKGFLQRIYKKLWNKNDTFTIRQWVVCPSNPSCYTKDCWIFSSKTLYIGERNSRRLSSLGHKNLKHHAMPNVVDFIYTFWLSL